MSIDEYQKFASEAVITSPYKVVPIVGFALGLAGESGEVIDDIKKKYIHGRTIDDNHTIEELGDVMWYVANLATCLEIPLSQVLKLNVEKLSKRYKEKYSK